MVGRAIACGLAWLVAAGAVAGASFHVDARDGDDAADGRSPRTAWRSLDKANAVVLRAGDRLRLRAGSRWQGTLKPQGSGKQGAPVVIDAYSVKGDDPGTPRPLVEAGGLHPAALHLRNCEHVVVRGLAFTNTGAQPAARRRGVWVELDDFGAARGVLLEDLRIEQVNGSLVKKEGGGAGIHLSAGGRGGGSRFDGVRIERCLIRNCTRNGITMDGPSNRGDWRPSTGVVIRGNLIEGVPGDGIVPVACEGALVEHNRMQDCPRLLPDGEAAAGIWPWSCDDTVVQFNEVSGHKAPWDGQGFDADWNCRGTVIQYNFSHDNEGGFLLVCSDASKRGNTSVGNHGTIVRHNLSVNDGLRVSGKHRGFSPVFHLTGNLTATRIVHNTVVVPARQDDAADRTLVEMGDWGGEWPNDTWFANNLVFAVQRMDWVTGRALGTRIEGNAFHGQFSGLPEGTVVLPRRRVFAYQDDGAGSLLEVLWQDRNGAARAFAPLPDVAAPQGLRAIDGDPGFDFSGAPVRSPLRPGAIQR